MQPQTTAKPTPDAAEELRAWYDNGHHVEFIKEMLGDTPWSMQEEIIRAVFKYPIVAVKSCNAVGKSFIASRAAVTFLSLKPGSIVITTAPTWRQVKDVLWREIRTCIATASFKLTDAQVNQVGLDIAEDWFAVGLSTTNAEKFFGYHADDILVIIDEASGVEEPIYVGVDAVTPNRNAHVLMIGNPTNPDGRFGDSFNGKQAELVKQYTISAFTSPNFVANDITSTDALLARFTPPDGVEQLEHMMQVRDELVLPYPNLIEPTTAYRRYLQWGPESPEWEALILGEFPSQADRSLIPLNLIYKSIDVWRQMDYTEKLRIKDPAAYRDYRKHPEWNVTNEGDLHYGLDVARYGSDKTVLFAKRGGFVQPAQVWAKLDTVITSQRVVDSLSLDDWQAIIKVDDTGVGGGVTDNLQHMAADNPTQYHYRTIPVNFGAGTAFPLKFFNIRAEMFWNLRQQFIDHKIAIPDDDDLRQELAAIRFEMTGKDHQIIKIEAKDDTKKRLGRSPDRADALALAFYNIAGADPWRQPDAPNLNYIQPTIDSREHVDAEQDYFGIDEGEPEREEISVRPYISNLDD